MSGRDEKWDIFRGIAILLVVIGHLVDGNTAMWNLIYVVHIPIFFIISGYFAFHSVKKYSFKENQIKKAKTLLLPWITWSAVAVAMNCLKEFVTNGFSISYFVEKFTQVYATSMSVWFLWALWVIFLLFALAYYFVNRICIRSCCSNKSEGANGVKNNPDKWLPLMFLFIVLLIPNTSVMTLNKIKLNAVWFLAGYLLHYINMDGRAFKGIAKAGVAYLPLYYIVFHKVINAQEFMAYYNLNFDGLSIGRSAFVSMVSIVYTLLGIAFVWEYVVPFIRLARLNKLFSGLGNATMEIYTIHMMFVAYVVLVPGFIAKNPIVCTYVYMPVYAMLICWFIKLLSEKVLHKIPPYNIFMLGKW